MEEHDDTVEIENMDPKELAEHASDKIDAVVSLLLKKNLISEDEFNEEFDSLSDDDDEEEEAEPTPASQPEQQSFSPSAL